MLTTTCTGVARVAPVRPGNVGQSHELWVGRQGRSAAPNISSRRRRTGGLSDASAVQLGDSRPTGRGTEGIRTVGFVFTRRRHECGTERRCVQKEWREMGLEVWNPEGVEVFGTPVGSQRFVLGGP